MGFCLFNNVAVAAAARDRRARAASRVFVLDWDVHHGNGTAEIFRRRARRAVREHPPVAAVPGHGPARRTRARGDGEGYTINLPVPPGSEEAAVAVADRARRAPRRGRLRATIWCCVSAGFDAHAQDPLANCRLQTGSFAEMAGVRARHARERRGSPVGVVLEGGYNRPVLAECVLRDAAGAGRRGGSRRGRRAREPARRRGSGAGAGRRGAGPRAPEPCTARRRSPRARSPRSGATGRCELASVAQPKNSSAVSYSAGSSSFGSRRASSSGTSTISVPAAPPSARSARRRRPRRPPRRSAWRARGRRPPACRRAARGRGSSRASQSRSAARSPASSVTPIPPRRAWPKASVAVPAPGSAGCPRAASRPRRRPRSRSCARARGGGAGARRPRRCRTAARARGSRRPRPAMPACVAIQPACRPITSTTITRSWDSAVVCRRSIASVTICTAVWKPNGDVGAAEVVVDRLGHAHDRHALAVQAQRHAERVLAADRDQRVDAAGLRACAGSAPSRRLPSA